MCVGWYSGYLHDLEFWCLHIPLIFCNLLPWWYRSFYFFIFFIFCVCVSSCKYWEWKKSLCILSCSDPLILPSIDIFLLIVSHYISWSGYWCSSCAVSLWCLLNVSICTPISRFFTHPHPLLFIGHHFVPDHSYL